MHDKINFLPILCKLMDLLKDKPNLLYLVTIRRVGLFLKMPVKKLHSNVYLSKILNDMTIVLTMKINCRCGKIGIDSLHTVDFLDKNIIKLHNTNGPTRYYCCVHCGLYTHGILKMNFIVT